MPNKYDGPSMDYGKGMPMGHESDGPGMHHESAKQERKDLMKDNPVVRDMDSSRPWMSKHAGQSRMGGSPLKNEDGKDGSLLARGARKIKKAAKKVKRKAQDVVSGAGEAISEFAQDMQKRGT
tara:strand:- start:305 stop:673 length:369 start_codon:yes stop_codon:yes gene_type:complete